VRKPKFQPSVAGVNNSKTLSSLVIEILAVEIYLEIALLIFGICTQELIVSSYADKDQNFTLTCAFISVRVLPCDASNPVPTTSRLFQAVCASRSHTSMLLVISYFINK